MARQKIEETIALIIRDTLKPGTDRGSTQAIIDTRDINVAARNIVAKITDNARLLQALLDIATVKQSTVPVYPNENRVG